MHRFVAGTCQIHLNISFQTAWAVRNGPNDPILKNLNGDAILPASSLKGVVRSTAESILRSLEPNRATSEIPFADATFTEPDLEKLERMGRGEIADSDLNKWRFRRGLSPLAPKQVYAELSPASQLFGATVHAGLLSFEDVHNNDSQFDMQKWVEPSTGRSRLTITITNFAFWQLSLLLLAIQEIQMGKVGVGAKAKKNYGKIAISVFGLRFVYPEVVYGNGVGIMSAQGWIGQQHDVTNDVPEVTRQESGVWLAQATAVRQPASDWQTDGQVLLVVGNQHIPRFAEELVLKAWKPWVKQSSTPEPVLPVVTAESTLRLPASATRFRGTLYPGDGAYPPYAVVGGVEGRKRYELYDESGSAEDVADLRSQISDGKKPTISFAIGRIKVGSCKQKKSKNALLEVRPVGDGA